jgi:hypothetical protein
MMTKTLKTSTPNTRADRQALYYTKQAEILRSLKELQTLIEAHGVEAASGDYHWGYIGDLTHIHEHLHELVRNDDEQA